MRLHRIRILGSVLPFIFCASSNACSCATAILCDLIKRPVLFTGEVIEGGLTSLHQDPWYSPEIDHVRLKVIESFRGLPPGIRTVDLTLHYTPGMCSPIPYVAGQRYLVAPQRDGAKLVDGGCFQGRVLDKASADLEYVREYFAGRTTPEVRGIIYGANQVNDPTFPFAGVLVTKAGRAFRTRANEKGEYRISVPAGSGYSIRAESPQYDSYQRSDVDVPAEGCRFETFTLRTRNEIVGRVDLQGKHPKRVTIGLVRAEEPGKPVQTINVDDDGVYRFENVPLGRYLVKLSPDGPSIDYPFASTFYPAGSDARKALQFRMEVSPITFNGVNVKAGPRVKLRQVKVIVQLTDGLPFNGAEVTGTGVETSGAMAWRRSEVYRHTDEQIFMAPTDQTLTFRVSDWYRRKLNADYVSTHKPGAGPLAVKFVVAP